VSASSTDIAKELATLRRLSHSTFAYYCVVFAFRFSLIDLIWKTNDCQEQKSASDA